MTRCVWKPDRRPGSRLLAITALLAGACQFDTRPRGQVAADAAVDGAIDGPLDAFQRTAHLFLSEVKSGRGRLAFVEIYNPTSDPITLSGVHLTDSPHYPMLPAIAAGNLSVTIGADDFIARFPDGAAIAAGEVLVVALRSPLDGGDEDFSIRNGGGTPDMVAAVPGGIGAEIELGAVPGEAVALFYWDGRSDLVADLDAVIAGVEPAGPDDLVDKTGMSVDGPDFNDLESTYRPDALTMPDFERTAAAGESYQRIAGEIGEASGAGNGIGGDDETSEDTSKSWTIAAPTPGQSGLSR